MATASPRAWLEIQVPVGRNRFEVVPKPWTGPGSRFWSPTFTQGVPGMRTRAEVTYETERVPSRGNPQLHSNHFFDSPGKSKPRRWPIQAGQGQRLGRNVAGSLPASFSSSAFSSG